jgi:DNA-binding CsgD family transcriptional regulator
MAIRNLTELTPREREVLGLLAGGLTNRAIGRQLGIGPKTVSNYVSQIFDKLGVTNRTQAAIIAMRDGLLPASTGQSSIVGSPPAVVRRRVRSTALGPTR